MTTCREIRFRFWLISCGELAMRFGAKGVHVPELNVDQYEGRLSTSTTPSAPRLQMGIELIPWFYSLLKKRPKGDEDRRSIEYRPAEFPPTSIVPAAPISIQVRRPTILDLPDTNYQTHENYRRTPGACQGFRLSWPW